MLVGGFIGLFYRYMGLFCGNTGLLTQHIHLKVQCSDNLRNKVLSGGYIELFYGYIGIFYGNIGLFCGNTELFCGKI